MKAIIKLICLTLIQLLVALVATIAIYFMGIGNGWELVAFPIAYAVLVCLVAIAFQRFFDSGRQSFPRIFVGALLGSIVGVLILLIPRAWGFQGVIFPIVGAIIGYQVAHRIK